MLPHNYNTCRFVTTDQLTLVNHYGSHYNIIACKLTIIFIHQLRCISFIILQLVTCDLGSFHSRLHEHVQSIASSLVCNTW